MMMRMIFTLMDSDGDGSLSLDEFQTAHARIYKGMDANKDGRLTMEEMRAFLQGASRSLQPGSPREKCMVQGWALVSVASLILCSPVGGVTAEEKKPLHAIRVLEATYGGNCTGLPRATSPGLSLPPAMAPISAIIVCTTKIWAATLRQAAKRLCASPTSAEKIRKIPRPAPLEAEAGKGGDDGEPNNFCLLHCLSGRIARASEGKIERGENSSHC